MCWGMGMDTSLVMESRVTVTAVVRLGDGPRDLVKVASKPNQVKLPDVIDSK